MARRVVVWTETASKQRREILKYWTLRNGSTEYAKKLIEITNNRIEIIIENPEAFKISEFPETRESALGNFSIYYKVQNDFLIVTAFWDNRQNPSKLLEILSKNQDK
jgi:plasmid stabilization system protein ParE